VKTACVGELAEQVTGVTYKKADARSEPAPGLTAVLRAGNISSDGELLFDDLVFVPESQVSEKQHLRKSDVLIATSSGSIQVVGKAGSVRQDHDVGFGAFCKVLRPGPSVDPRYFAQYFKTIEYRRYVENAAAGININNLKKSHLDDLLIPLPPLEEQRRIAAILDAADRLRTKRRQALAKLDTLTQAIFIDMFGDPRSSPFDMESVGELAKNEDAIRVPVKLSDREAISGIYPYYGASGVIDHVDDYLFDGRRLLVAEDGANLLARSSPIAFLATGQFWVNNHAHVLADNGQANLVYLCQAIELLDLAPFVTGSAQPKLNRKKLDSIKVPSPPRLLQDQFEERVEGLLRVRQSYANSNLELDTLFASLQQRAFRGEL